MLREAVANLIQALGQPQLLAGIDALCEEQLHVFLEQLTRCTPSLSARQRALLHAPKTTSLHHAEDPPFHRSGNSPDYRLGEELLAQGKVGCLILAGGQGTRLGFDGPKGMFPVTPITKKSLFQVFCERIQAASRRFGHQLPLCIMTSPTNHAQTVKFLVDNSFFGLAPSQIEFFQQETLPFLDDLGQWLLEKPGQIAEGPDGNGHALHLFFQQGIWERWRAAGIAFLNLIFVDNVLADPFDPECVGLTCRTGVDATLKAVERLAPQEKMGVPVLHQGGLSVVEYSELPPSAPPFSFSSTGMFCLAMPFIAHLYAHAAEGLPLHLARKTAQTHTQGQHPIWKCERFLFDLLKVARSSALLVCPRDQIYAPLKNATGEKSLETVHRALFAQTQILL